MKERIAQFRLAFERTRELDSRLVPWMAGAAAIGFLVPFVVLLLLGQPIFAVVSGILFALLAATVVLGRRASAAQFGQLEGRPGAAAAVLNSMRGAWHVTPAIAFTRKQDFVHRVVGRPGIILVGEGSPARVKQLLAQERKRVQRVAGDAEIEVVSVGDGDGQVGLSSLTLHMQRLPKNLKKGEAATLERKLAALNANRPPIPQGYMPRPGKKQR